MEVHWRNRWTTNQLDEKGNTFNELPCNALWTLTMYQIKHNKSIGYSGIVNFTVTFLSKINVISWTKRRVLWKIQKYKYALLVIELQRSCGRSHTVNVVFAEPTLILAVAGKRLTMKKIKTTLKKLKRGDVVSIDWIDAGDLSGGFQEKDTQLLVILSIVLNLVLSFNPLCV